jgi:copper chaperone CopZ
MKTLRMMVMAVVATVVAIGADKASGSGRKAMPVQANATNRITVEGMHCDGCAKGLCAELKLVPGVAGAVVSLTNGLAQVAYDSNRVSAARLLKAVKEAGFQGRIQP